MYIELFILFIRKILKYSLVISFNNMENKITNEENQKEARKRNRLDSQPIVTGIRANNEYHRNRLDSLPIVTGMGAELPKDDEGNVTNDSNNALGSKKRVRPKANCLSTAFYGGKSPDSKKKKEEDEIREMKTFKDLNDPYEAETMALSGLTQNIEEKQVKDLIESFSPVIRNFPEQIKKEMLEMSEKWTNRKEIFIGAINYVINGRKGGKDKEEEINVMGIDGLSETLIREIENRMPKFCRKCNEWYIVKLNDFPDIHCMWCKVGSHDCTKLNEAKDIPGIKWLCETCEPMFNTHFLPKLDQSAFFEGFNVNHITINGNLLTEERKTTEKMESEEEQEDKEEVEIIENPMESVPSNIEKQIIVSVDTNKVSTQPVVTHPAVSDIPTLSLTQPVVTPQITETNANNLPNLKDVKRYPNMNRDQICRFHTRGSCRYGANGENELGKCNGYHPIQCKEYNQNGTTENGCKKGNECNNWHATYICRLSANSNICPRVNCIFKHHKNCSTTRNDNDENFLANNQQHRMARQHRVPNFPRFNNRQPHQQQRHQQQQQYMNNQWPPVHQQQYNNQQHFQQQQQWPPVHHHQYNNQLPQVSEDRLVHLIQTVLREESTYN